MLVVYIKPIEAVGFQVLADDVEHGFGFAFVAHGVLSFREWSPRESNARTR
jgi:hypothetical protein